MQRREFLKSAAAAGVGMQVTWAQQGATSGEPKANGKGVVTRPQAPDMQYRQLGTTGETVSLIGMGGFHIGHQKEQAESVRLIRAGIDAGITFMDNCWDYNDGISEVRMGQALKDGYRQKVFLMSKMDGRTAEEYDKQLEQSMGRLDTDVIDLVQFHEVIRMEDPDRIFMKGGAIEAAVKARDAGKIRYIGFTGHKDPAIHLRMLEVAKKHNFHFDTVQMPINVMDAHFRSFTHQVVPVAVSQGIGVLGMKTFGDHAILTAMQKAGISSPIEMIHYGLSQPVSVLILGIDTQAVLEQSLEAARTFKPMPPEQMQALLAKTAPLAENGESELFKISTHFDGTQQNPKWLGKDLMGTA